MEDGPIASIAEPGIKADGQLLYTMRKEVAQLLGRAQTSFPGAQPVSFGRKHIKALKDQEYVVLYSNNSYFLHRASLFFFFFFICLY